MSTHALVQSILVELFKAEYRRLNQSIIKLNQQNKRLQEVSVDGFLYQGHFYCPQNISLTLRGPNQARVPLHLSLTDNMERHLQDVAIINEETQFISQMLFTLLAPCRSAQHIRDTLPECLIDCVTGLSGLSRTREPAWTIQDNPRALRQYEKILPKMEVYSAARLLY